MAAKSWNHQVRLLAEDEIARLDGQDALSREHYGIDPDADLRYSYRRCRTGKCKEPATHATRYDYVTGRSFRTSWAERKVCKDHA